MKSSVIYTLDLPERSHFPVESVLFYDSILSKNPTLKSWLNTFEYKTALNSGESLKTVDSLHEVLNKVSDMKVAKTTALTFIAVGGGSVGDFIGFAASVYLRGRRLVQIPSTWLAAVDSAHGGKNALNLGGVKNQIGTIYPAEEIFISKKLLLTQPNERLKESMGEIIKVAVLADKKLFSYLENSIEHIRGEDVFTQLSNIISLKYKIISRDPYEKKGIRRLLNLGHTMGHVFEAVYGWPHGVAILLGLQFSVRWSFYKKMLSERDYIRICHLIESLALSENLNDALKKLNLQKAVELLLQDKKITSQAKMDFIFVKSIGSCVRESTNIKSILAEISRQKQEY